MPHRIIVNETGKQDATSPVLCSGPVCVKRPSSFYAKTWVVHSWPLLPVIVSPLPYLPQVRGSLLHRVPVFALWGLWGETLEAEGVCLLV